MEKPKIEDKPIYLNVKPGETIPFGIDGSLDIIAKNQDPEYLRKQHEHDVQAAVERVFAESAKGDISRRELRDKLHQEIDRILGQE